MVSTPVTPVVLYAKSFAEEACFTALRDLHTMLLHRPEARLIGGMMVTLHIRRWDLDRQFERQTLDTDIGVAPKILVNDTLIDDLKSAGYTQASGGHFERAIDVQVPSADNVTPVAVIDVLVPALTSRARTNVTVGAICTTEVLGLAEALQDPGITIAASLRGKSGWTSNISITIPSEPLALGLKAFAWRARMADKDAFDMWRMLEVCHTAGLSLSQDTQREVADSLRRAFSSHDSQAMIAVQKIAGLDIAERRQRWTRIQALLDRVA